MKLRIFTVCAVTEGLCVVNCVLDLSLADQGYMQMQLSIELFLFAYTNSIFTLTLSQKSSVGHPQLWAKIQHSHCQK